MDLEAEQLLQQQMMQQRNRSREESKNVEESKGLNEYGEQEKVYVSYVERCKLVGRIGPKETKLDPKTAYGDVIFSGRENLDVEAISSFASIRANTGVFSGRYFYEV